MYLSIGNGKYIRQKDIIGIFDMDTATVCIATRNFLSTSQKKCEVELADEDIPKSFILTDASKATKERKKVILCKLSSGVLYSRLCNGVSGMIKSEDTEDGSDQVK